MLTSGRVAHVSFQAYYLTWRSVHTLELFLFYQFQSLLRGEIAWQSTNGITHTSYNRSVILCATTFYNKIATMCNSKSLPFDYDLISKYNHLFYFKNFFTVTSVRSKHVTPSTNHGQLYPMTRIKHRV